MFKKKIKSVAKITKKKPNQEDIDSVKHCLYHKIFDVKTINNNDYYIDKTYDTIWDDEKNIVGIINKNELYFFKDIDTLIDIIKMEEKEYINKYVRFF